MTDKIKEELDTLVRDLTKVGSIPKSEARRRILELLDQYATAVLKEVLPDGLNDARYDACYNIGFSFCKEELIKNAKEKFNLDI